MQTEIEVTKAKIAQNLNIHVDLEHCYFAEILDFESLDFVDLVKRFLKTVQSLQSASIQTRTII